MLIGVISVLSVLLFNVFFSVVSFTITEEELISNSRQSVSGPDNLKHQMEMLSFSIARTTTFINKQTGKKNS